MGAVHGQELLLLRSIEKELASIASGITDGSASAGGQWTQKYIFEELSRAATESCCVVEAYDDGSPMPAEVRTAVAGMLHAASSVLGALAQRN